MQQLLRSATRAEELFANDTASLHLTRVDELLTRDEPDDAAMVIEVGLRLGAVCTQVGSYREAATVYQTLLAGPAALRVSCGLAASLRNQGEYSDALAVLAAAHAATPEERALLALERGRCLMVADSFHAAIDAFNDGLAQVTLGDLYRATLLHELGTRGVVGRAARRRARARPRGSRRVRGDRRPSSPRECVTRVLGGVYEDLGRLDDAVTVLRDGLALAERTGRGPGGRRVSRQPGAGRARSERRRGCD